MGAQKAPFSFQLATPIGIGECFVRVDFEWWPLALIGSADNCFCIHQTMEKQDVTAEAGKNYFVWQEVKVGFIKVRNSLQVVVDDQTGRRMLHSQLWDISEIPRNGYSALRRCLQLLQNPPACAL